MPGIIGTKEMLDKVQDLKEQTIMNGFKKPEEVDKFFSENWMHILDILDDALYGYLTERSEQMTINGAIMELVMLCEHPMMPNFFKPSIQKVIETISEAELVESTDTADTPQTDCHRCKHFATYKCHECFDNELFEDSGYVTRLTDCPWK